MKAKSMMHINYEYDEFDRSHKHYKEWVKKMLEAKAL